MVWYIIGVYIIKRTLQGRLEIQNLSPSVEKYFTSKRSQQIISKNISRVSAVVQILFWELSAVQTQINSSRYKGIAAQTGEAYSTMDLKILD